jgi:hypothetical protein
MKASPVIKQIIVAALLCVAALAQSPVGGMKHFAKDGLAFDYPAEVRLVDESSPQEQRLILTRAGSSLTIMVQSPRELISSHDDIVIARDAITTPFVNKLAKNLNVTTKSDWQHARCIEVGARKAMGFRLEGTLDKQPTTAEVYVLIKGQRFVNLIYVRVDKDDAQGDAAWKTVRDTLKVDRPPESVDPFDESDKMYAGGLLNGKALVLGKPPFPVYAKSAHLSGSVEVKVVIDTDGKVISTHAVSGPPVFREGSEKAAMRSKFSPTAFCGEPVKVSGIITFNYVAQQ